MNDSRSLSLRGQLTNEKKKSLKEVEKAALILNARNDREKERLKEMERVQRRTFESDEEDREDKDRIEKTMEAVGNIVKEEKKSTDISKEAKKARAQFMKRGTYYEQNENGHNGDISMQHRNIRTTYSDSSSIAKRQAADVTPKNIVAYARMQLYQSGEVTAFRDQFKSATYHDRKVGKQGSTGYTAGGEISSTTTTTTLFSLNDENITEQKSTSLLATGEEISPTATSSSVSSVDQNGTHRKSRRSLRVSINKSVSNLPNIEMKRAKSKKGTILIGEHHDFFRWEIIKNLFKLGYDVQETADGHAATFMLENCGDQCFRAMIIDVNLPIIDGVSAIEVARAVLNSKIPIIAISQRAASSLNAADIKNQEEITLNKAIDSGANQFLFNPINKCELENVFKALNILNDVEVSSPPTDNSKRRGRDKQKIGMNKPPIFDDSSGEEDVDSRKKSSSDCIDPRKTFFNKVGEVAKKKDKTTTKNYDDFEPHLLASMSYCKYEDTYEDVMGIFKRVLVIDSKKQHEQSKFEQSKIIKEKGKGILALHIDEDDSICVPDNLVERLKQLKLMACEWKEMYCGIKKQCIPREISSHYDALIIVFNDEQEMSVDCADLIIEIVQTEIPILFVATSHCPLFKLKSYVETIMKKWCLFKSNLEKARVKRNSPSVIEQKKDALYVQSETDEERLARITEEVKSSRAMMRGLDYSASLDNLCEAMNALGLAVTAPKQNLEDKIDSDLYAQEIYNAKYLMTGFTSRSSISSQTMKTMLDIEEAAARFGKSARGSKIVNNEEIEATEERLTRDFDAEMMHLSHRREGRSSMDKHIKAHREEVAKKRGRYFSTVASNQLILPVGDKVDDKAKLPELNDKIRYIDELVSFKDPPDYENMNSVEQALYDNINQSSIYFSEQKKLRRSLDSTDSVSTSNDIRRSTFEDLSRLLREDEKYVSTVNDVRGSTYVDLMRSFEEEDFSNIHSFASHEGYATAKSTFASEENSALLIPKKPSGGPPTTRVSVRRRSKQSFDIENTDVTESTEYADDSIHSEHLMRESSPKKFLQDATKVLPSHTPQDVQDACRLDIERLGKLMFEVEKDLSGLENEVEEFAEITNRNDYANNVKKANGLYEELKMIRKQAIDLQEQERTIIAKYHLRQEKNQIEPPREQFDGIENNLHPLITLWNTISEVVEKIAEWREKPLHKLESSEIEKSAKLLCSKLAELIIRFQAEGAKRNTTKLLSDSLISELKIYLDETIPFVKVLSNLKINSHWVRLEKFLGLKLLNKNEGAGTYESLNIDGVLGIGLQNHVDKIGEFVNTLKVENSVERLNLAAVA